MVCRESFGGEVRAVHLIVVLDDTLQRITAMLILALSIFILSVGENATDIKVMLDLLKNIIVFYKCLNGGNSKDGGVLAVSCFSLVVLNDVVCNKGHSLVRHI